MKKSWKGMALAALAGTLVFALAGCRFLLPDEDPGEAVVSIRITEEPRTAYFVGESFDPAGMEITAIYEDGHRAVVEEGYTWEPDRPLQATDTEIVVRYQHNSAKLGITVTETEVKLDSIRLELSNDRYVACDPFNEDDFTVTAVYTDDHERKLEKGEYTYQLEPEELTYGERNVLTVTYSEYGVEKSASTEITVSTRETSVDRLDLTYSDTFKKVYYNGDTFDPAGMTVTAHYTDGHTHVLAEGDYEIKANDPLKAGDKIAVTYTEAAGMHEAGAATAEADVTVIAKQPQIRYEGVEGEYHTVSGLENGQYTVTLSGAPVKEGYRFDGWNVTVNGEPVELAEGNTFTVKLADDMNVVITAKWVQQFTVTVEANDGGTYTLTKADETEVQSGELVDKGTILTLTVTANPGYTVDSVKVNGADAQKQGETYSVTVSQVTTIEITFAAKQPQIRYEGLEKVETFHTVSELKDGQYTVTLSGTPIKEGFRFDGWSVTVNGEPAELTQENTFTVKLADEMNVVITAKWEQVEVTVTKVVVKNAEEIVHGKECWHNEADYDFTGLELELTYNNGNTETVIYTKGETEGVSFEYGEPAEGKREVTVVYGEIAAEPFELPYSLVSREGHATRTYQENGATVEYDNGIEAHLVCEVCGKYFTQEGEPTTRRALETAATGSVDGLYTYEGARTVVFDTQNNNLAREDGNSVEFEANFAPKDGTTMGTTWQSKFARWETDHADMYLIFTLDFSDLADRSKIAFSAPMIGDRRNCGIWVSGDKAEWTLIGYPDGQDGNEQKMLRSTYRRTPATILGNSYNKDGNFFEYFYSLAEYADLIGESGCLYLKFGFQSEHVGAGLSAGNRGATIINHFTYYDKFEAVEVPSGAADVRLAGGQTAVFVKPKEETDD